MPADATDRRAARPAPVRSNVQKMHIAPAVLATVTALEEANAAHAARCQGGWVTEWTGAGPLRWPCFRCQPTAVRIAAVGRSACGGDTMTMRPNKQVWYPHLQEGREG